MYSNMAAPHFKNYVVGANAKIQLNNGKWVPSINFDNAATTPPFVNVLHEITAFAPMYSSVHRGTGYKSKLSTELFETSRLKVLDFVNAEPDYNTVIFLKNTTEAINKISYRFCDHDQNTVILSTAMEHHSNDLPWRGKYPVDYIETDDNGRLRLDDLENKLKVYNGKVKLVTVTGASNVTGYINPIYEMADLAHKHNAKILVDGAQLVAHAPIDMKPTNSPYHLDFLVFSAHKMYAPFGTGVLIGPTELFRKGPPEFSGGGTVRNVTRHEIIWDDPPLKEEAGTPNIMGVVALGAAIDTLRKIGMQNVYHYENGLWNYAMQRLIDIPGIKFFCDTKNLLPRIGIIPFNINGISHTLVAGILAEEAGIAVRSGCFCAQPYVWKLLNVPDRDIAIRSQSSYFGRPGMVRISFGLYNDYNEIDVLVNALAHISEYKEYYKTRYLSL